MKANGVVPWALQAPVRKVNLNEFSILTPPPLYKAESAGLNAAI